MAAELAVEENMNHDMSTVNIVPIGRRLAPRLGAALVLACALMLMVASAAFAAVEWRVTSVHGPQNMAPNGTGQYVIQVYNIGDTDGNTLGDLQVDDVLPSGVIATATRGTGWACSGVGTGSVSCTQSAVVLAPRTDARERGAAPALFIDVSANGSPSGNNEVAVTNGDAAGTARDTDPTTFSGTSAGFGIVPGTLALDAFDAAFPGGTPVRQAGSHPFELRVDFDMNLTMRSDPTLGTWTEPDEYIGTTEVKLPPGLIGNPQAVPQCRRELVYASGPANRGLCPNKTQVGTVDLIANSGSTILQGDTPNSLLDIPVFNMEPPKGAVAAFAFVFNSIPVWIVASLDPSDHYAVVTTISATNDIYQVRSANVTFWGVPADPAHDPLRLNDAATSNVDALGASSIAPIAPFLTLPSLCDVDGHASISLDSWQHPGQFVSEQTAPVQMTGCDDPRFRFSPSMTVQPDETTPSTPTGLDVHLVAPQKPDAVATASDLYAGSGADEAIATPPLRNVKVTLPEGMAVSPSSADGLGACMPLQIGLGTNDAPTCPDASKIGTAELQTPLLADPVGGSIYLATQNDNPFGSMLALYLVLRDDERGLMIKLPGKIAPDPATGQLTATFDDNPQVPFASLHLRFKGGPRAPLVTPPTCGVKTTTAEMSSWNLLLPAVQATDSFTVDGNCTKGFDPGFTAGTQNPIAGQDSPLVTRFSRTDGDEELSTIDVSLPKGLLGKIADVVLCADAAANAGTCGEGSLIGKATIGAGPGSNPFYITDGRVHMTGPYKGAPFGLSIVVHAKAGPLDLGNVVVRAAVHVDKHTAQLRVVSDPMPTILEGIPLQVRVVDITVDRPGFTLNPTNCSEMSASATIGSTGGKTSTKSSRFQVGDCANLSFQPRMKIRVGGKNGETRRGRSTPLTAAVRIPKGNANLRGVKVTLPKTINARLDVINKACTRDEYEAGNCEEARAGTAVAVTPLLRDPLRGNVYFVRNGNPLPDMFVALRGQVDFDLIGKVAIPGSTRLQTNFDTVPDVPITKFALRLVSGSQGPVGNAANLCTKRSRRARMGLVFEAQSGKVVRKRQKLSIRGCKKAQAKGKRKAARRSSGGTARTR